MKHPIDTEKNYQFFLQETGQNSDDMGKELCSLLSELINIAYENGKRDALIALVAEQKCGATV